MVQEKRPVRPPFGVRRRARTAAERRRVVSLRLLGALSGLVGAAAAGGASWYASGALLTPRRNAGPLPGRVISAVPLAAASALPASLGAQDGRPGALHPTRAFRVAITGDLADRPGTWGLHWDEGSGVVDGPVLGLTADGASERVLHLLDGELPHPVGLDGLAVGWDAYLWGNRHPLPTAQHTTILGPLGALRAVAVPAAPGTSHGCVVHVHGRSALPAQSLRLLRTAAGAGWDGLAISYRNSDGAPETGRYTLGGTEWEDVHAAVAQALVDGHRRIVLAGCSMGGAIILAFLQRSSLAGAVVGVILDAPVLDWPHVLRSVSRNMRAGAALGLLTPFVLQVAAARGAGGARLRLADSVTTLAVPTLILHGSEDIVTPVEPSLEAARARPDLITTHIIDGAMHATAWNTAPDDYDAAVRAHLERVLDEAGSRVR